MSIPELPARADGAAAAAPNRFAPPEAELADFPLDPGAPHAAPPPLWNPGAAASWSLVFTPVFGALIHRGNWLALGDAGRAEQSRRWALASAAVLLATMLASILLPQLVSVRLLGRVVGFGLLVAWYYAIGKSQATLVAARYGRDYPRRSWGQPFAMALQGVFALFVLFFFLGLILSR